MADEIRKVIEVDVSKAVSSLSEMEEVTTKAGYGFKSLGEAKKYIDKLRASLIDLEEGSVEYTATLKRIDSLTEKVKKSMSATSKTATDAAGSYNALSKQMSELKKRWKETNDEAERETLGKQIVNINDQLKSMDASIGNYQRNVGNYEGAFTKGLGEIAKKFEALGNPLAIAKNGVKALGTAFKALIANPIGAVILAIVTAVKALKKGFEGSEEASNKLKQGLSALQPVANAISNILTGFATVIGNLASKVLPALVSGVQSAGVKIAELLNKIGIVSDEKLQSLKDNIVAQKTLADQTQKLTEREIQLTKDKRAFEVEEAKKQLEISELKAKAADKEHNTAEQRQKYLEKAINLESAINQEKVRLAQEEYDIALENSKLTDNDAATNQKLADLEANLYRTKKEFFDKEKELLAQKNEARNQQLAAEKKLKEDEEKAEKEHQKKLEELRKKELEEVKKIQERVQFAKLDGEDKTIAELTKKYEEEKALLEKYGEDTVNLTIEYQKRIADAKTKKGEDKLKEIDEEIALQTYLADKTIQVEWKKQQRLLEIERQGLLDRKAILEDLLKIENLDEDKRQDYADEIAKIEADLAQNSESLADTEGQNAARIIGQYVNLANSLSGLMDSINDIWQESIEQREKNGEITEEQARQEFEESKKLQIASAVITGLAGIAAAIASPIANAQGPIGWIAAGLQAATIATTTALQIAKIQATEYESASSSSISTSSTTATPSTTATAYSPSYSTNVTGVSESDYLSNSIADKQNSVKVYVLESDIENAQKKVSVRESETTF